MFKAMLRPIGWLTLGLGLALGSTGLAAEEQESAGPRAGKAYLNLGLSAYRAPGGDNFHGGPAIGIGYMTGERLGVELLYSHVGVNYQTPAGEVDGDADLIWLNALYKMGQGGNRWQPFGLLGVGRTEIGDGFGGDTQVNAGFAVFGRLDRRWAFRADLRAVHSADEGGLEPFALIGMTATLGELPPLAAPDSDGDGVPDPDDRCPNTPAGIPVDAYGCPLDSDGDGVPDYLDECPGTVAGAVVDEKGCHLEVEAPVSKVVIIEFDFDSAQLREGHYADIRAVAQFMREHPNATAVLAGHTDVRGPDSYNQRLSERRANAVLNRLVEAEGISPSRLQATGFGEARLLTNENTQEAHQRNRRVRGQVDGTRMVIRMR